MTTTPHNDNDGEVSHHESEQGTASEEGPQLGASELLRRGRRRLRADEQRRNLLLHDVPDELRQLRACRGRHHQLGIQHHRRVPELDLRRHTERHQGQEMGPLSLLADPDALDRALHLHLPVHPHQRQRMAVGDHHHHRRRRVPRDLEHRLRGQRHAGLRRGQDPRGQGHPVLLPRDLEQHRRPDLVLRRPALRHRAGRHRGREEPVGGRSLRAGLGDGARLLRPLQDDRGLRGDRGRKARRRCQAEQDLHPRHVQVAVPESPAHHPDAG